MVEGASDFPYRIGRVARAHGLKGDVVLQLFRRRVRDAYADGWVRLSPPFPAELEHLDERLERVSVTHLRWLDPLRVVLRVSGWSDREAAERRIGTYLDAHPEHLPSALTDPVDACFEARALHAESGEPLGEVIAIRDNGAQALLELELEGGAEALVPYVPELVVEVGTDEAGRFVRILPLPGLLEVNA
ncbi:MAG: hypothetical protein AAFU79_18850 [Myxococcota bacterium]